MGRTRRSFNHKAKMYFFATFVEATGSWNQLRLCIKQPHLLLFCDQGEDEWMLALCVSRRSQVSQSNRHSSHSREAGLVSQNKCLTISYNNSPTTSGYIISIAAVLNISFVPGNFPCIFQTQELLFFFFATDNHRWMLRDIKVVAQVPQRSWYG